MAWFLLGNRLLHHPCRAGNRADISTDVFPLFENKTASRRHAVSLRSIMQHGSAPAPPENRKKSYMSPLPQSGRGGENLITLCMTLIPFSRRRDRKHTA